MSKITLPSAPAPISIDVKKSSLQSALFYLIKGNPFLGAMLQELTVRYNNSIPTAAIGFNKKNKVFEITLNEHFYCNMELAQRIAILSHEILHFLHQHLFRLPFLVKEIPNEQKMLFNIAGDMAINQYISNLPKGAVDVRAWKMDNGQPFPVLKTMEEYYELICSNQKNNKDKMPKEGQYQDGGNPMDVHGWEDLTPEEKEEFLGETQKLIQRTIDKTSKDFSELPGYVKDILQRCEVELAGINYKKILREAIKKNASCADRESTWNRPNKRIGNFAQGTRLGRLPKLNFYVDTSGSISHNELNEFLAIMDRFLKVGTRSCTLALWHTEMYYQKPYKYGQTFNSEDLQSGGTDVGDALRDINKKSPDLSIVLTDGYYGQPKEKPKGEVIWIISKGGDMNHPLKGVGKTINLDKLKE